MADWHKSKEWAKAREYAKTVLDPICAQCGAHLTGGDWTIDHIIPPKHTGEPNHDISNLQSMCRALKWGQSLLDTGQDDGHRL